MFTSTSLHCCYCSRNIPKRDPGQTRRSSQLFLVELDKRLSLGKDEELRNEENVSIGGFI